MTKNKYIYLNNFYTYVQDTVAPLTAQFVKVCEFCCKSMTVKPWPAVLGVTVVPPCTAKQFEKVRAPKSANDTKGQLPLLSQLSKSSTIHSALVPHNAAFEPTDSACETVWPEVRFSMYAAPLVEELERTVMRIESPALIVIPLKSYE